MQQKAIIIKRPQDGGKKLIGRWMWSRGCIIWNYKIALSWLSKFLVSLSFCPLKKYLFWFSLRFLLLFWFSVVDPSTQEAALFCLHNLRYANPRGGGGGVALNCGERRRAFAFRSNFYPRTDTFDYRTSCFAVGSRLIDSGIDSPAPSSLVHSWTLSCLCSGVFARLF